VVIVKGFMASLNVALTVWLIPTPVAPLAGAVEITVGEVLFEAAPVVKVHGSGAKPPASDNALPARSLAPAVTVAVYVVLGARLLAGVKVAIAPALPA
jgi:hypothetical protein